MILLKVLKSLLSNNFVLLIIDFYCSSPTSHLNQGILKGEVSLYCLTGLKSAVWQLNFFVFICKTDWSKPAKQEVNSTVILSPLVFPGNSHSFCGQRPNVRYYPSEAPFRCSILGYAPGIIHKHYTWLQRPVKDKYSSL